MNELSNKLNVATLISTNYKVPDLSILHLTFKVNALNNVYHELIQKRNLYIGNGQEINVHGVMCITIEGIDFQSDI